MRILPFVAFVVFRLYWFRLCQHADAVWTVGTQSVHPSLRMSTWRKKKGQKFFSPPSNRIRQRRGKGKKVLRKSLSWYPERPDTASFSSAADLIAQVRYEALIEARAKTIAKRHCALIVCILPTLYQLVNVKCFESYKWITWQ